MAEIKLFHRILIHDKNGKLVRKTELIESKSFLIQFLEFMYGAFNKGTVMATNIDNAETEIFVDGATMATMFRANGIAGNVDRGIVVGTGSTTPTNTDHALETKIAHGVGAGQLNYGASSFFPAGVVAPNVDLVMTRAFSNGSGNTIGVNEIGIEIQYSSQVSHLIIRDVLGATVDVLDTQSLTVQYTWRTTV